MEQPRVTTKKLGQLDWPLVFTLLLAGAAPQIVASTAIEPLAAWITYDVP